MLLSALIKATRVPPAHPPIWMICATRRRHSRGVASLDDVDPNSRFVCARSAVGCGQSGLEESASLGPLDGLRPARGAELRVDAIDVRLDGGAANPEPVGDPLKR
jgi:hypothetical protein